MCLSRCHLLDAASLMPGAVWKSDSSVWELKKDGNGEHLIKAGTVLSSILCVYLGLALRSKRMKQ